MPKKVRKQGHKNEEDRKRRKGGKSKGKQKKTNENKPKTTEKNCILEVPNPAQSKLTKIIWVKPLLTFKKNQTDSP